MAQVIIFQNEQGGVSVCTPTGEMPIEQVQAKDTPAGSIIVDNDSLPYEHINFFDAWELNGTTVTVSLDKAKAITKDRLRIERAPLLQAQDVAFQRALEENADTTAIVAEKQRLRDITQLADQATTLDELKAITPLPAENA
jgi:hypothetical protein